MNEITNQKTMSIKEVSELFGVTAEAIKWHVRKIYPNIIQNGKETFLTEEQITEIKKKMIPTSRLVGINTDIEMEDMTLKVIQYHISKYNELSTLYNEKNEQVKRLIHDQKTYTTTEIAKELNLKSATELNKLLEEEEVQYKINGTWVLTAQYSSQDYESIKQEELDNGKIIYNRHWTGKGRDFILKLLKVNL
jgi:predicted transcriptional regulator